MASKRQELMAYDLALTFTKDKMLATELAEAIIKLCHDICEEEDGDDN